MTTKRVTQITKVEVNHDTGVITIEEFVSGKKCVYQPHDAWKAISKLQEVICNLSDGESY